MDELNAIWEKYSASGWTVTNETRKPYLEAAGDSARQAARRSDAPPEGEYDALYKRMLAQKERA